jgi:ankyrin repeat protein
VFAWKGEFLAVEELCKQGAEVDAEDCMCYSAAGNTPLHIAALSGHLDVIRVLIEYGAASNCKNAVNCT